MQKIVTYLETQAATLPREWARVYLVAAAGLPSGAFVHGTWAALFWGLDIPVLAVWDVFSTLLWIGCSWALITRRALILPIVLVTFIEVPIRALLATYYFGTTSAFWAFALLSMIVVILTPFGPRPLRYALAIAFAVLTAAIAALPLVVPPPFTLSPGWEIFFLTSNLFGAAMVMFLLLIVFELAVDRAEAGLEREFNRAETLLRNILPDAVALRLKNGETVIADEHKEVSVVFADIVDFTSASARLSPRELVETLNTVFSAFDALAQDHGAEKIKTIGDAYMVVIGVPKAHATHAEAAVELALAMHRAAAALDDQVHFPVRLRIGVNSGPVVAGVIGTHKFAYDLWGDAVNVASRMESHGDAGKVMISDSTRALLPASYAPTDEGLRDLKGKGPTRVWSLRPEMAEGLAPIC